MNVWYVSIFNEDAYGPLSGVDAIISAKTEKQAIKMLRDSFDLINSVNQSEFPVSKVSKIEHLSATKSMIFNITSYPF